jgi:DNA-binding transcriptional MerR regulator
METCTLRVVSARDHLRAVDDVGGDDGGELTIDQLAQRTGMTVRNIRAHQSRGLLPPPDVRGRTGYYGEPHVARLELIREMQAQGFNLEAIRRLLEAAPGDSKEPLRFVRAVQEPFVDEHAEVVTLDQLVEEWGDGDVKLLEKALKLGVLRDLGDGRYEQASPRLARAGAELRELGLGEEVGLELLGKLRKHADGVARAYVDLFVEQVWEPFQAAGAPPDRWPEVHAALERLRPLAAETVLGMFGIAMSDAVDEAFGREVEKLRKRK